MSNKKGCPKNEEEYYGLTLLPDLTQMGPRQVLVLVLVLLLGVSWCGAEEGDTLCSAGRRCVSTVDCEPYTRASDKLRQLDRGSAEYRQLLARLKQQV